MFQGKEWDKLPETNLNEIEISDIPSIELKVTVIKMHWVQESKMSEQRKNFKRERENIKKYLTEIRAEAYNRTEKFNREIQLQNRSV